MNKKKERKVSDRLEIFIRMLSIRRKQLAGFLQQLVIES